MACLKSEESCNVIEYLRVSPYPAVPTAPRSLTLVMGMMGEVELDWLPPETPNGDVTYTVRKDEGDDATGLRDTSYPVTNQPSGTAVSFTVVAVTNNGTSQESNSVSFCNNTGE